MEAHGVIVGQLEGLLQELLASLSAVNDSKIDDELRERVVVSFETTLQRLCARTDALRKRVQKQQAGSDESWRDLRTLQTESRPIFDECLAFVQGAWARRHGLDQGVCSMTDALLSDLSHLSGVPWNRFTLLGTSEFYRPTAAIIRIRYPEVSLWSMPLSAHEFGHFVGPELRRKANGEHSFPLQTLLEQADGARGAAAHSSKWHHLQEYFADVFATYSLGPAYAAAMVLLRMNPLDAHAESKTHPSNLARAHGIFSVLDALDARAGSKLNASFGDITGHLRELWRKSLDAVGQASDLAPAQASGVTDRTRELIDLLTETTPERLQFGSDDWLRAQGAAHDLSADRLPEGLTRRDVLNSAWLARLRLAYDDPGATAEAARAARTLYQRVPVRNVAA